MREGDSLIETQKADFSNVYDQPDPRAYFGTLKALDYQIPQQGVPVFNAVLDALPEQKHKVIDICCSYGINAAMLSYDVDMADLNAHYADPGPATISTDDLLESDREFFSGPSLRPDVDFVGLDVAQPAIDYAVGAGLLANGWAENLETSEPSPELVAGISDTDLIISTGGVGYVGRPTFEALLGAIDDPENLWLAIFVLRVFDYGEIADVLTEHGLITEQVPDVTFPQRRFADREEQEAATHDVLARGLDPAGKEADGWFHADCFLSRPAAAAAETPLSELLAGVL
ncbi:MAG TPA: class I SAM-dependent methyltransferase [Mycobacteriales bacterium]|nr:class I SAM-dependent methyltransferase [Mycobacteriales bacterium]